MKEEKKQISSLSDNDLLLRHQLNVSYYWHSKSEGKDSEDETERLEKPLEIPSKWDLLKGIELHQWQKECRDRWFQSGKRGVAKVVTGAGKTLMALSIMQELQNNDDPELCVAIVVPTIVLMNQWYDALMKHGNLPASVVGRMGGGYKDSFADGKLVMVCVLASAMKLLPKDIKSSNKGGHLLLIADECHKAGAEKMSEIFRAERKYSLGLSATPERDDITEVSNEDTEANDTEVELQEKFDESLLGRELGPIIYELTFNDAIEQGIMPRFEIRHYGLPLVNEEPAQYDRLSRDITELRKELQRNSKSAGKLDGGALVGWARKVASRRTSRFAGSAGEYVLKVGRRKLLLYHGAARSQGVIELLKQEFKDNPDARVILFHESIDQVMRLYEILRSEGFKAVPENSKLPDSLRVESIELFRSGTAQVLISARSLIEGFDVPAADVGIVVASSSSVRQRIQTLGRILRKHKKAGGEEKHSVLHVLYMANTVDEMIYEKNDWDRVLGAEKNIYFKWDPFSGAPPVEQPDPPRRPLPSEDEIDWSRIKAGDEYPGRYEGKEYSIDSQNNITDQDGRVVCNSKEILKDLAPYLDRSRKFRVTPKKRAVLFRINENGDWRTRYAGILAHEINLLDQRDTEGLVEVDSLKPGDEYPGSALGVEKYQVKQRSDGFLISKRVKRGEVYARTARSGKTDVPEFDPVKRRDADRLIAAIMDAMQRDGEKISQVMINKHNHALFIHGGKVRFLCKIEKGLEFPE
jgi:superfamily II DNA or RNA helicase